MVSRDRRRTARAGGACLIAAVMWMAGCGSTKHGGGGGLANGSGAAAGAGANGGSGGTGGKASAGRTGGGSGGTIEVTEGGAGGDCEREVTLKAVVLGEPGPFDLIIVADHSDSLAWSRDELSSGLKNLLTNVQGRAVRIFLLTPTQYGASSEAANTPFSATTIVAWQDPLSLEPYENAMTEYVETCADPNGVAMACPAPTSQVLRDEHGIWNFLMPQPIATLEPDMTDAEFAREQTAVADAILALSGTGSPQEMPLCTLGRYVSQPRAMLPQNAVFVVLSDEDDVSVPDDCLVSFDMSVHEYASQTGTEPCASNCDAYRYGMTGDSYIKIYPYTCAGFSDTGARIAGSERGGWLNVPSAESCAGLDGPCSVEEEADAGKWCDAGLTIVECTRECMTVPKTCSVDVTDPNLDPCNQSFSYNGQTWANVAAYCATQGEGFHDCTGGGVHFVTTTSIGGSQHHENLMPGTDTGAVARYFTTQAASAFGAGRYLVEGIVFEPRFGCELGVGQSYATNLVAAIGDPTHVFSLCDGYAPALDGVLDFAQALIETEFTLELAEDEHVTAVVVLGKNGAERTLLPSDYTFDEDTGLLSIDKTAVHGDDANLRVEVTSDCRPLVR